MDGRHKPWSEDRKQAASRRAKQQWDARKDRDDYHDVWSYAAKRRTSSMEARQQLSNRMKARWDSGNMQDVFTPESRAKARDSLKRICTDPAVRESLRQRVIDAHARGDYDKALERLHKPSSLECSLAMALDEIGVFFVQQFKPDGYWRYYDFYLPAENLLIEVDGTFWHSTPEAAKIDVEKDEMAAALGYELLRVAEVDLPEFLADLMINA